MVVIERTVVQRVEVDMDALMAKYGVSGFRVTDAGLNEARDFPSVYIAVDVDDNDQGRCLLLEPSQFGACFITDADGGDLTDAENDFFCHIANIVTGYEAA